MIYDVVLCGPTRKQKTIQSFFNGSLEMDKNSNARFQIYGLLGWISLMTH